MGFGSNPKDEFILTSNIQPYQTRPGTDGWIRLLKKSENFVHVEVTILGSIWINLVFLLALWFWDSIEVIFWVYTIK